MVALLALALALAAYAFRQPPAHRELPLVFGSPGHQFELGPRRATRGTTPVVTMTESVEPRGPGVELSWQFAAAPRGEGPLVVSFSTSVVVRSAGAPGFQLGDALLGPSTWVDATGQRFSLVTRARGSALEIEVPAEVLAQSTWPAVLDPLLLPGYFIDAPVTGAVARTPTSYAAAARHLVLLLQSAPLECRYSDLDGGLLGSTFLVNDAGGFLSGLAASDGQHLVSFFQGSVKGVRRLSDDCQWLGPPTVMVNGSGSIVAAGVDAGWWVSTSVIGADGGAHIALFFEDLDGGLSPTTYFERPDVNIALAAVRDSVWLASAPAAPNGATVSVDCYQGVSHTQTNFARDQNYNGVWAAASDLGVAAIGVADTPGVAIRPLSSSCSQVGVAATEPYLINLDRAGDGFLIGSLISGSTYLKTFSISGAVGAPLLVSPTYDGIFHVIWSARPWLFINGNGGRSYRRTLDSSATMLGPLEALTVGPNEERLVVAAAASGLGWVVWQDDRYTPTTSSMEYVRPFDVNGPRGIAVPITANSVGTQRCMAVLGSQAVIQFGYDQRVVATLDGDGGVSVSGVINTPNLNIYCSAASGTETAWLVTTDYDFTLSRYVQWLNRIHADGGAEPPLELSGPYAFIGFDGFLWVTATADGRRGWIGARAFAPPDLDAGRLFELGDRDPAPAVTTVLSYLVNGLVRTPSALCQTSTEGTGLRLRCVLDDGGVQRDSLLPQGGYPTLVADVEVINARVSLSDGGVYWAVSSPDGGLRVRQQDPLIGPYSFLTRLDVERLAVVSAAQIDGGDRAISRVIVSPLLILEDGRACPSDDACISGSCVAGLCCPVACPNGTCAAGLCIPFDAGVDAGGAPTDAGTDDAGEVTDGGVPSDAGTFDDAGSDAGVSGEGLDSGTVNDAGTANDAGAVLDGDAGRGAVTAYKVGCGCGSVDTGGSLSALLLAALAIRRRSRA